MRSRACSSFRSAVTLRLLRLKARKESVWPWVCPSRMPQCRLHSPSTRSILTTSAPRSPRICVASGPCTSAVKSSTRRWLRGPGTLLVGCSTTALLPGRHRGSAGTAPRRGRARPAARSGPAPRCAGRARGPGESRVARSALGVEHAAGPSMVIMSPSRSPAIGPPAAASGLTWPTIRPRVAPVRLTAARWSSATPPHPLLPPRRRGRPSRCRRVVAAGRPARALRPGTREFGSNRQFH